jgi:hypothetical protein
MPLLGEHGEARVKIISPVGGTEGTILRERCVREEFRNGGAEGGGAKMGSGRRGRIGAEGPSAGISGSSRAVGGGPGPGGAIPGRVGHD